MIKLMKSDITKRQKDLLLVVYKYIKDSGYSPTIEEMRENLQVVSNQSVLDLLNHLERKKYLQRKEGIARSIVILPLGYEILGKPPLAPFLGLTSAGAPTEAIEIPGEWQTLSQDVSKLNSDIFLLKINGDSMINAGIDDGDVVLVKSDKEFVSGEIVLAEVEYASTVKRFMSEDKPPFVYLKPENPKYPLILFTEKVKLMGKVISVLKKGTWKQVN